MNTINWHDQVKVGRGFTDTGAWHRALEVARDLHEAGRWNGDGLIIIHDAYDSHRTASYEWLGGLAALLEGTHYEIVRPTERLEPESPSLPTSCLNAAIEAGGFDGEFDGEGEPCLL